MTLSGVQRKKIQDALIDAFPSKSSLERMLSFELDKNLNSIAGGDNLQDIMFNLIKIADAQGWAEDLVCASHHFNQKNLKLKETVEYFFDNTFIDKNEHVKKTLKELAEYDMHKQSQTPGSKSPGKKPLLINKERHLLALAGIFIVPILSASGFHIWQLSTNVGSINSKQIQESQPNLGTRPESNANASAYYNRGLAFRDNKDYDRAIAEFNQALNIDPNNADFYHARGYTFYRKQEYDEAILDFTQAIKLKPDNAKTYFNRGAAYNSKKDYDSAIADFNQALKFKPNYTEAYNYRELAYKNKGTKDKAKKDFRTYALTEKSK